MINYKYYSLSMSVNTFYKLININILKNHDLCYHMIMLSLKNTSF